MELCMKQFFTLALIAVAAGAGCSTSPAAEQLDSATTAAATAAADVCVDAGPQTPRDISSTEGLNSNLFELAPQSSELNLCNIHTHTNAEHKGPGYSVFVGADDTGGYACNDTASLTAEELRDPLAGQGAYQGVKPGDTIEVHWVYSSCDVAPGKTLGACLTETCTDPLLRVEAQTFLVVNDANAIDFMDYTYQNSQRGAGSNAKHQPAALPQGTGTPVVFHGSTTGPGYSQAVCSPLQVTWSVRPQCERLDISSLHVWAESNNVFEETKSHGVRQLVTDPRLLSPIK